MNLYVLRHGLAEEADAANFARDADRPLTPKGERKLRDVADALEAMGVKLDLVLSSPYVRARQTADLVAARLKVDNKVECSETLTPGGRAADLVELINSLKPQPEEVLLVGHEPYLSELISLLISGKTHAGVVMKKGGLCLLQVDSLQAGRCAALEWLLTPKQMKLMS